MAVGTGGNVSIRVEDRGVPRVRLGVIHSTRDDLSSRRSRLCFPTSFMVMRRHHPGVAAEVWLFGFSLNT